MKFNLITHITTACNYDCSYCDVIKDKKNISRENRVDILNFIKKNCESINRFKFFGGEPLLAFENIKYIIDNSRKYLGNNYEIVTNTSLLKDEVGEYFEKYFEIIYFSIDTENNFDYDKVSKFIFKYNLKNKVYFNIVISPGKEMDSLKQFTTLYDMGLRGFNILPVYFTKVWKRENLTNLSKIMKIILDKSIYDSSIKLQGFQENSGTETSLANNTIFIDVDLDIYYSDIVSTFLGFPIKKDLYLGKVRNFNLNSLIDNTFTLEKESISKLEDSIYNKVKGQKELHKVMDYFSIYLNKK